MSAIAPFPLSIATAIQKAVQGIAIDDTSGDTKPANKIFLEGELRAIPNTRRAREIAYSLDALVQLIISVQVYSILGNYDILSDNDTDNEVLIETIQDFVESTNIMQAFRKTFPDVKMHGFATMQKLYKIETRTKSEPRKLRYLQRLVDAQKHTNPFDETEYYYYQDLKISKDWKDPSKADTQSQKVWFIPDGEQGASNYSAIATNLDRVVDRADIIEIRNKETGISDLGTCLNEIFIKHLLIICFPNMLNILGAPEEIILKTFDDQGNRIFPEAPPASLAQKDNAAYTAQKNEYDDWVAHLQDSLDEVVNDRLHRGITVHPDYIIENFPDIRKALSPETVKEMMFELNREIAWGMGFSMSLLDAHGAELTTARNVLTIMAIILKGIQNQYEKIANELIYEQFGDEAKTAGIKFKLSELDPQTEMDYANIKKVNTQILEIFRKIGASDNDIRALSTKFDIAPDLELGGMLEASSTEQPYSTAQLDEIWKLLNHFMHAAEEPLHFEEMIEEENG